MFICNLPPALFAECPGSFARHCGNTGVERTPNESQHILPYGETITIMTSDQVYIVLVLQEFLLPNNLE